MHRGLTATAATAALITLVTGCSSATTHAQAVKSAAASTSASHVASTAPATTPSSSPSASVNPAGYLTAIRALADTPGNGLPALKAMSDAQLTALGNRACTELRKPMPVADVRNELSATVSRVAAGSVLLAASDSMLGLCPEQQDRVKSWVAGLG